MTRGLKRYYGADYLHYITFSGYQRRPILGVARRRDLFLNILEQARRGYGFVVVAYVVMPEHVHLLFSEPERGTPSTVVQVVKQRFAHGLLREPRQRSQPAQGRWWEADLEAGHIWQRRSYDPPIWNVKKRVQKSTLYSSQSGEARAGAGSGAVEVEQLSGL